MAALVQRTMEKFPMMLNFYLKYRNALGFGLVTLLTAGGERIFSATVFECPCHPTWNVPYGLVFLLVPALALLLPGYILNARTWRLLTGCCVGASSQSGTTGCQRFWVFVGISAASLVAPLTWLAVALLGGTFYECSFSAVPFVAQSLCLHRQGNCTTILPKLPCLRDEEADLKDLLMVLQAQSQVAGWTLIAVIIISLLIAASIKYCRSPVSFMELKFWKIYMQQEQRILKNEATEYAKALADKNVECFFKGVQPDQVDLQDLKEVQADHNVVQPDQKDPQPDHKNVRPHYDYKLCQNRAEDWRQISSLYTFNSEDPYYSVLHKYVNRKEMNGKEDINSESDEGFLTALGFGFVDAPDLE